MMFLLPCWALSSLFSGVYCWTTVPCHLNYNKLVRRRSGSASNVRKSFLAASSIIEQDNHTTIADSLIDDGTGHVRSDLATSIWNWDHEHRRHVKDKQEKFPFSTRAGLRWVDEIANHLLERGDAPPGNPNVVSSTSSSSRALAQDSSASSYNDLVQEGVVALLYVMTHYQDHVEHEAGETEASSQHSFETYAKRYIAEQMSKSLASSDARPIQIPKKVQSLLNHARRVRMKLLEESNNGTEPSVAEVAKELGVSPEKLQLYQIVSRGTLSMERTVEIYDPNLDATATFADLDQYEKTHNTIVEEEEEVEEGDDEMWVHQEQIAAPLKELIPDYDTPDKVLLQKLLQVDLEEFLVRTLTDPEVQVIRMRYGLGKGASPMKSTDIALKLGLSPKRVRDMERQAMDKLKDSARSQAFEPYLEEEHDGAVED